MLLDGMTSFHCCPLILSLDDDGGGDDICQNLTSPGPEN